MLFSGICFYTVALIMKLINLAFFIIKAISEYCIGFIGKMLILITVLFYIGFAGAVQVDYGNPQAFEGDIGLDPETREFVNGKMSENSYKGVFSNRVWPNGRIAYMFDRGFDNRRQQLMNQAFEEYNRHTCIRFRRRTKYDRAYIKMVNENACWSIIGRSGGEQLLKLGSHCLQLGTAIHELMHAVGFYHEQSRYDRDSYVRIFWNNIRRGEDYNFQKYRSDYYGQGYDLNSIMHYRNNEFGAYGRVTIQSIKNPTLRLGNTRFSESDKRAINKMYGCSGYAGIHPAPTTCKNEHKYCEHWAKRKQCTKNAKYMKVKCKPACGIKC